MNRLNKIIEKYRITLDTKITNEKLTFNFNSHDYLKAISLVEYFMRNPPNKYGISLFSLDLPTFSQWDLYKAVYLLMFHNLLEWYEIPIDYYFIPGDIDDILILGIADNALETLGRIYEEVKAKVDCYGNPLEEYVLFCGKRGDYPEMEPVVEPEDV